MDPGIKQFFQSWAINTLAVLLAVYIVPGIQFKDNSLWTPFVTSLVLGILNAFFKPILMFFALPLLIFTLGLFTLVINALLLYLTGLLLGGHFEVESFWSALFGAIVIGIVSLFLNTMTGGSGTKIQLERRKTKTRRHDEDGPVIDV